MNIMHNMDLLRSTSTRLLFSSFFEQVAEDLQRFSVFAPRVVLQRLRDAKEDVNTPSFISVHENIYHYGFCLVRVSKLEHKLISEMKKLSSDLFQNIQL